MNKIVSIKDNYSVEIVPDLFEKNISVRLVDEINSISGVLAVWSGGKWSSDTPIGINKFFEVTKKYPKVKRAVKASFSTLKENANDPTKTVTKTWSCFRRRVNVKIHNIVK
jgi:hypothetical protein